MTATSDHLLDAVAQHPLLEELDEQALRQVIQRSSEIHLAANDLLYTSGEEAVQVFVILSGALQIEYPTGGETRGRVVAVMPAPSFLGEAQVVNDGTWSGTGVAIAELSALGIRKDQFATLVKSYPGLTRRLYLELTHRFYAAIESWRHLPTSKPAASIARYLLARRQILSRMQAAQSNAVPIHQGELGRATGIRRETVNRTLAKWAEEGWVQRQPTTIDILKPEALEQVTEDTSQVPLLQPMVLPLVDGE
ncbi:Crp/Fnr family transcriptional regulator [Myxococcota bacterium]